MTIVRIDEAEWRIIKEKFETGMYSTREIARQHGVRDKRISDKATKEGWIRAFAYHSTSHKRNLKKIEEQTFPDDGVIWPQRHLDETPVEQINPPDFEGFHRAVKSLLKKDLPKEILTTDIPECGPEIPSPFVDTMGVYSERYEAIRVELNRRRNLAKVNRLDEDTLVKLIDRVGALDTEGAINELVTARMQVNADTLARTAELKSIRDRYMSLVCDFIGPDPGKAASAGLVLLAGRNDTLQGAIKMIADLDKLITETERKAFEMDKPMPKVLAKSLRKEDEPFDISGMTTEQLAVLSELAQQANPEKRTRELPLPPKDN